MNQSWDLYRTLVEISPDAICVLDADSNIFFSNNQTASMLGYAGIKDIVGKQIDNFLAPDDCPRSKNYISRLLNKEDVGKSEFCFIKKDGTHFTGEITASLIELKEVSPAILLMIRDITERWEMEKKLAHLASFPENNSEPIVEIHESGTISYANPTAKRIFPDLLVKGSEHPFVTDWKNLLNKTRISEGQPVIREISVEDSWYRQNILYFRMNNGIRFYGQNITKRIKAEEALLKSETELELIMNSTPALISYIDTELRYRRVNKNYEQLLGMTAENIQGHHIQEFLNDKEWQKIKPYLGDALNGKTVRFENYLLLSNGRQLWLQSTIIPDRDSSGKVHGIIAHAVDITDRKTAEDELGKAQNDLEMRVLQQTQELRSANELLQIEINGHKRTFEDLKVSERRYRTAIDFTYTWEYWTDPEGNYIYISPSCRRISGYSSDEFLQDPKIMERIIHPDDRLIFSRHSEKDDGPVSLFEFRIITRNGTERWLYHMCQPVFSEDGDFIGRRASNRDITEYKMVEEALKASGAYNRSLIETSLDPLVTIGPDGKITDVNTATESVTGCKRNELVGTDFADYFTEPAKAYAVYKQVFEKGLVRNYPLEIRHRNGTIASVLYNASVYRDINGNVVGVFAAARDITERKKVEIELDKYRDHLEEKVRERTIELENEIAERKKVEDELLASEENLRMITKTTPVLIAITRISDGKIIFTNPAYQQTFGYSEEELLGHNAVDMYWDPFERAVVLDKFNSQGFIENYELRVKHKDGTLFWISSSTRPIIFAGEKSLLGASIDITDRKIAEEKIRQQVDYTTSVINNLPGLFYAIDENGNILETNGRFSEVSGYSHQEIQSMKVTDLFMGDDIKLIGERIKEVFDKGESNFEADFITKNGRAIPYYFTGSRIIKDGNPIMIGMGIDITESRHREKVIESSLREKEVLIKEIHHRVKNNLQLISSILNLQSVYTKDKKAIEAFKDSQNRIRSMALIHEKLYKSKFLSNINIREYIDDITGYLFSSYYHASKKIKLNSTAADLDIEIDKCISVGLILNELISNSLKHGFADKNSGEINIDLQPVTEHKLLLIFSDNGKGMPKDFNYRNSETLGLQLIISLVEQLNGSIELENTNGVKYTISINV